MRKDALASFCGGTAIGALCCTLGRRARNSWRMQQLLGPNATILNRREKRLVHVLIQAGHGYIFRDWPPPGQKDVEKRRLVQIAAKSLSNKVEDLRKGLIEPPIAAQRPHIVEAPHGRQRNDPYYWLRDDERSATDVIEYLEAETSHTKAIMADTDDLQKELFQELRGRIQEKDGSVPVRKGGYYWYSRTEEGKQYSVYCRRACTTSEDPSELDTMDPSVPEEILLDANEEARSHAFYMLGSLEISPDHSMVAYACDITGNEKYTLYVKDIKSGKQRLARPVQNTAGDIAWSSDNSTLFYVTKDAVLRPDKVWRHTIGSDPDSDVMVYHEEDPSFNVEVALSRSQNFIFIDTSAAVTSETLMLDANTPEGTFNVIVPRANDKEYSVDEWNGFLFMRIRDTKRPNCELVVAPISKPSEQTVLVKHKASVKLEDVILSQEFLTLFQRKDAQQLHIGSKKLASDDFSVGQYPRLILSRSSELKVAEAQNGLDIIVEDAATPCTACTFPLPCNGSMPTCLNQGSQLQFDEPAYSLRPGQQGDFGSEVLRVVYSSLTTPPTVIDQHLKTQARATKKVEPVQGFNSSSYKSERIWATADDGQKVPVSIAYKISLAKLDGSDPLLLDGYGSYGICNNPRFDRDLVSLLDRGFVYAIAHVRGGGELGRAWYEDGKFKKKMNTFTDFIAVAEHLVAEGYTKPQKLCIQGRSAGGLLIGAVLNLRPELFQAAILGVPFVDVVTTMLDESIPLTTGEFEEWGNPAEEEYYDYMLSYSPVDQLHPAAYPHMLVLAGLHDPRVAYWEPAKYTAKLRKLKTDSNLLLFKCDMGAGHFSQSGRFDQLHDVALEQAFLLKSIDTPRTSTK